MPRNGSGVYTPPLNSWNPAIDGALATPADWNSTRDDISSSLSQSVSSDGQTEMTGNLNMAGNRVVQMAAPSSQGQALRWEQMIKGADIVLANPLPVPTEGAAFTVTGNGNLTSILDSYPGRTVVLMFTGTVTLVHSASLVLPNAANLNLSVGDLGQFVQTSPGIWTCLFMSKDQLRAASTAQALALALNTVGITPASLSSVFNDPSVRGYGAGQGWFKLPNGYILQWGSTIASSDYFVPYPISFPNSPIVVLAQMVAITASTELLSCTVDSLGPTGFNIRKRYASNGGVVAAAGQTAYWFAIGT